MWNGGGGNWKRICENKKWVGFSRKELSLRDIGTTFSALSSGHGPRGLTFQGGEEGWIMRVILGGRCW